MELRGKKVLLIVPRYYGYEKYIQSYLEKQGAIIQCIYENLDEVSFCYRFIYVYIPSLKKHALDRYYIRKIKKCGKKVDYVFAIRASSLSLDVIRFMKGYFQDSCKYIMYQWDGVKNNANALEIADEFESVFTFDVSDAQKYGWTYRPLFYINELLDLQTTRSNDVLYICSLHSKRVDVLNRLKEVCQNRKLKLYFHMYSKKLIYYKRKYFAKKEEYLNSNDKDISFETLSIADSYRLYGKSNIVVDFTHPGQTGYTMRTIECVGNRCKLITNNEFVKTADFYDSSNVFVYSGTAVDIPNEFLTTPYKDLNLDLYRYYSLDGWFETIFGG